MTTIGMGKQTAVFGQALSLENGMPKNAAVEIRLPLYSADANPRCSGRSIRPPGD
jgi:hypothetical protein